jgi:hypothetical protein
MKFNKLLKSILIATFTLFGIGSGLAQQSMWAFTYDVAFPMGETADYIGNTSWRGITIQGRTFIKPNISVGGSFSWQVFFEKVDETVDFSYQPEALDRPVTGTLSGKQYRYINSLPIMVNAHYYMGDALINAIRPFAGLSVGMAPTKKRTEVGIIALDDFNWHFALAPEIGVLVPLDPGIDFIATLKYNAALKTNDSINYSYLNIQIGLASVF